MRFLLLLCLFSFNINAQVSIYNDIPYDNIEGVDNNLLSIDVYVPDDITEPMPIAIYVHGGGWCIGDKSNVHDKAALLTNNGYMFVSVNYRLSPFPYELENPNRIQFPDHPNDVAKAIAFIMDHASEYGGDIHNVFLFGHSSGAHLVATVLSNSSFLENYDYHPSDIQCACIMDTGGFELGTWITESATDANLFINAFSDDPVIWEEASPSLQISENVSMPDVLLIYQDNPKRIEANEDYADIIRNNTSSLVEEINTAYDHQQINQLLGSYDNDATTNYTQSFLDWLLPCMSNTINNIQDTNTDISPRARYNHLTQQLTILEKDEFLITDLSGRKIKTLYGIENETYSLSNLNSGMYIISSRRTQWNLRVILL